jgi:hypothetical protein
MITAVATSVPAVTCSSAIAQPISTATAGLTKA